MATIKTDTELNAQTDAVIKVNGNREITPGLDNALRKNVIASKLSIKDGGRVMQVLTGYATDLTPTDDKDWVPKKYVDDLIASGIITLSEIRMEDDAGVLRRLRFDASGTPYTEII